MGCGGSTLLSSEIRLSPVSVRKPGTSIYGRSFHGSLVNIHQDRSHRAGDVALPDASLVEVKSVFGPLFCALPDVNPSLPHLPDGRARL